MVSNQYSQRFKHIGSKPLPGPMLSCINKLLLNISTDIHLKICYINSNMYKRYALKHFPGLTDECVSIYFQEKYVL